MEAVEQEAEAADGAAIVWETPDTPITNLDFVLYDGIRFVRPYFFEFIAHVKQRWDRKTITSLFAEEFRQRPLEYYIEAVEKGRIQVNGKKVTCDYVVRSSQTLSHFVHRHEPPVMGEPVKILELTPDVVIVWKPSSVPVHPCGQYRKNTVLGILEAEHDLRPLYPIHRLDRLVSGLLILARNAETANKFRQKIEGGKIIKLYVAKVKGIFPAEEVEVNLPIFYDAREGISMVKVTDRPGSGNVSLGSLCKTVGRAKDACTKFRRLSTDGECSIIECIPFTGRTHQIRVHLQHLGHPIANDDLYDCSNPSKRSEMGTNADRAARVKFASQKGPLLTESSPKRRKNERERVPTTDEKYIDFTCAEDRMPSDDKLKDEEGSRLIESPKLSSWSMDGNGVNFALDPLCTHCPKLWPSGYEGKEHGLWLHCRSYTSDEWSYACPLPSWAKEPL